MKYHIVVSRYNENINWTKLFDNVIIYNKGTKIENLKNQICLKNVGREGDTYFRYIYDNYDDLNDYTIFLQGFPFDHSPNLIQKLNTYINEINNENLIINFEFLSEEILNCNLTGCARHSNLPLIDVYERLFDEKKDNMEFIFGAGAQFIVSKNNILKHSKEFYLKIIQMLEKDVNPIEGYVIERFHKLIFD
jgi:hypothetical protein